MRCEVKVMCIIALMVFEFKAQRVSIWHSGALYIIIIFLLLFVNPLILEFSISSHCVCVRVLFVFCHSALILVSKGVLLRFLFFSILFHGGKTAIPLFLERKSWCKTFTRTKKKKHHDLTSETVKKMQLLWDKRIYNI